MATKADRQAFVRVDTNRYSVPVAYVDRPLTVCVDDKSVRVLCGDACIATHPRSYGKRQCLEQPAQLWPCPLSAGAKHGNMIKQHLDLLYCYEAGIAWCTNPGNGIPITQRKQCIESFFIHCLEEEGIWPAISN